MTEELLGLLAGEAEEAPAAEEASAAADLPAREEASGTEGLSETEGLPETEDLSETEEAPAAGEAPPVLRGHFDSLLEQGEALRRELPGFSLDAALADPDFLRLTSPAVGVSVRRAWYALHGRELAAEAARRAAERLSESLALSAARPREGGRGLSAGALGSPDPRALSAEQRAELRRRVVEAAARGEKLYP